jgi:site-specific DNA-methyltransferase (adenine-specific)/modification methylase
MTVKLLLGDCLELMKDIPDKSIDLVLTDPPYNAKNIGFNSRKYAEGIMQLPEKEYDRFCKEWSREAFRIGKAVVFTPGIVNQWRYPKSEWVACWIKWAACSFNHYGGFNAWEPILLYGKNVSKLGYDVFIENTLNFTKGIEKNHPCPKPLNLMLKLIKAFSKEGQTILDPMMGSGTTGVACVKMKRNFVGIEKVRQYYNDSKKRIREEENKLKLF